MQTDDALLLLAYANEDDVGGSYAAIGEVLPLDFHLVRWNDRHTAPCDNLGAEEVDSHWRHSAPGALALKGSDGTWIGNEECRFLPHE